MLFPPTLTTFHATMRPCGAAAGLEPVARIVMMVTRRAGCRLSARPWATVGCSEVTVGEWFDIRSC